VEASRNFANKIWNASRFVMMNLQTNDLSLPDALDLEDKWIVSRFNTLTREVTENLDRFELGVAADKLYSFIWDEYCDWYIELCKTRLTGDDAEASLRAQRVLGWVLCGAMKLLHPFMPFLTEQVWQAVNGTEDSIMVSAWPTFDASRSFPAAEEEMRHIMDAIRAVRNRRAEMNVPPSRKADILIVTEKPDLFAGAEPFLRKLASASVVHIAAQAPAETGDMASMVTDAARLFMPLSDLVDLDAERERLTRELAQTLSHLEKVESKLTNESFIAKAPEKIVAAEREKADKLRAMAAKLEEAIAKMVS